MYRGKHKVSLAALVFPSVWLQEGREVAQMASNNIFLAKMLRLRGPDFSRWSDSDKILVSLFHLPNRESVTINLFFIG